MTSACLERRIAENIGFRQGKIKSAIAYWRYPKVQTMLAGCDDMFSHRTQKSTSLAGLVLFFENLQAGYSDFEGTDAADAA